MCFGLADKFSDGSTVSGPGALDIGGALPPAGTPVHVAAIEQSVAEEGCVGETLSAVEAGVAAALATDPVVAAVLRTIADDEARHAALAWRFVQWRVSTGASADSFERAVDSALRQHEAGLLATPDHAHAGEMRTRGILTHADRLRVLRHAAASVVPLLLAVAVEGGDGVGTSAVELIAASATALGARVLAESRQHVASRGASLASCAGKTCAGNI
jgi:hypothetical protein